MTFTDHFSVIDDAVGPQPWMQMRLVATEETTSVTKSYDPTDGWAKNDLLQTVLVSWTNNSPVAQWVYGMVTSSGRRVTLQCRSRGFITTSHGYLIGDPVALADAGDIDMAEVSRHGVGVDVGTGGLLAIGGAYGIAERRANSGSMPLMPQVTGDFLVAAGDTLTAYVTVSFISEFWENTQIDGGDGDTEATAVTGDLRVDLYATPSVATPVGRNTPTIVGVGHDREVDLGFADTQTGVNLPAGVADGDILLAIVANQFGLDTDIQPVETGWSLVHSRNEGIAGWEDVHMKIYARTADASEPATYHFENGLLAEETAVIIALRDTVPFESAEGANWHIASNLARYQLNEQQIAPSIGSGAGGVKRNAGQLLIAVSFFAHALPQAPITQTPPTGMTELVDLPGVASALAIAVLDDPPSPTRDRLFRPSTQPVFSGHSITASILVPGVREFG